jgi:O-antigen/teichoic acid export membrane protein
LENKFLKSSTLLVLDNLLISLGAFLFWIIIPRFSNPAEIGYSSAVISTVALVSSIAVLGLEYPLLKRAGAEGKRILSILLTFELLIHAALIPLIIVYVTYVTKDLQFDLVLVASVFLVSSGAGYITRYFIIGVLNIEKILLLDLLAVISRYSIVFALSFSSIDSFAIVTSYVVQQAIASIAMIIIVARKVGLQFTLADRSYLKTLLMDGISNFPGKLAKIVIASLSVIILSLMTINVEDVAYFYIPLMISLGVGGLAASIATVAIPTSSLEKYDHTFHGIRFSLLLVVPCISLLVAIPEPLLSIISSDYVRASTELQILGAAALPFAIVMNAITFLNNQSRMKDLAKLGIMELIVFLALVFPLTYFLGTIGSSLSILLAFGSAMVLSLHWLGKSTSLHVVASSAIILITVIIGQVASMVQLHYIFIGVLSFALSFVLLVSLRVVAFAEIKNLIDRSIKRE